MATLTVWTFDAAEGAGQAAEPGVVQLPGAAFGASPGALAALVESRLAEEQAARRRNAFARKPQPVAA